MAYPDYIDVKNVQECLEKRHELIHEMKKFTFTKQQIHNYASSMMLFLIQSALFCNKKINENQDIPQIHTVEIVEDDVDTLRILQEILEEMNFKVVSTATNGKIAVSEYVKSKPDIVLLDLLMPKFDGFYALERIKKKNKKSKVIIFTSDISPQTKRRSLELGASAILYKPSGTDTLFKTINDVLTKNPPMIVEKQRISKKLREQMMKENVKVWTEK